MAIQQGQPLPKATLFKMGAEGPEAIQSSDIFQGKKVVLFGVPGAFTPGCSQAHLPGYVVKADEIKAKGVDTVACMAVNDAFVMGAWGKEQKTDGKVTMLADGSAEYSRKLGLETDLSGYGMGLRGKRFSLLVDDGVVKAVNVDDGEFKATSAESMLEQLG